MLIRFVSQFTSKLCNLFFISPKFNTTCMQDYLDLEFRILQLNNKRGIVAFFRPIYQSLDGMGISNPAVRRRLIGIPSCEQANSSIAPAAIARAASSLQGRPESPRRGRRRQRTTTCASAWPERARLMPPRARRQLRPTNARDKLAPSALPCM